MDDPQSNQHAQNTSIKDSSTHYQPENLSPSEKKAWTKALILMALTFLSTFYVGANMVHQGQLSLMESLVTGKILSGWVFSIPLMSILMAHEFGHYFVGKHHRIDISPPYFIPVPIVFLGTMGAVIRMRGLIRSKNALFDVGASGPIAGLVIAIPVLIYGILTSPIEPIPTDPNLSYIIEGRSIFYLTLLFLIKGPIPDGYDIFLTPTALAGWAGLLVTMLNLLPVGQLDGGHIAYAYLGERQNRYSKWMIRSLPIIAIIVGLYFSIPKYLEGERGLELFNDFGAGMTWLVWWALLSFINRIGGGKHPPTNTEPLSPTRQKLAIAMGIVFVLLFMPSLIRLQ